MDRRVPHEDANLRRADNGDDRVSGHGVFKAPSLNS